MKRLINLALAAAFVLGSFGIGFATEYTKGVVKKVDAKAGKITVIHEELKNLDMPAMTMVFRAGDDTILSKMQEGEEIEFVADRVNGKLTIIELK